MGHTEMENALLTLIFCSVPSCWPPRLCYVRLPPFRSI